MLHGRHMKPMMPTHTEFQRLFVQLCISLLSLTLYSHAIGWLAVASVGVSQRQHCKDLKPFVTRRQLKLCRQHTEHMQSVQFGAGIAVQECEHQFQHRRWNCSSIGSSGDIFTTERRSATRETAFLHAIASAAVAHSVTRDCTTGRLRNCGCDLSLRGSMGGFRWAGCSDNIHYGSLFSKRFVDAHERKRIQPYDHYLMNLHNNEAGRKVIANNMRVKCKCHGVSGSCELKTCWKRMPTFREIGEDLKNKFDGATEVALIRHNSRRTLSPVTFDVKPPLAADLVYLEQSPNYCVENQTIGSLGTSGRECNATSASIGGCDLMCCDRGYQTMVKRVVERCECKFIWCCEVRCKQCKNSVELNICN